LERQRRHLPGRPRGARQRDLDDRGAAGPVRQHPRRAARLGQVDAVGDPDERDVRQAVLKGDPMLRTRWMLVLGLLAAALLLAACGGGAENSSAGGGAQPLSLAAPSDGSLKFDKATLDAKSGKVTIDFDNPSGTPHAVEIEGNGVEAKTKTITNGKASVTADL